MNLIKAEESLPVIFSNYSIISRLLIPAIFDKEYKETVKLVYKNDLLTKDFQKDFKEQLYDYNDLTVGRNGDDIVIAIGNDLAITITMEDFISKISKG